MTNATEPRQVELRWQASSLTKAIATCAGVALAAAVLGRWQLVAFAAPLLGVLCSISWQRPSAKVYVHGRPTLTRCFEADETQLSVWTTTDPPTIACEVIVSAVPGMQVEPLEGSSAQAKTVAVSAERWGRYPIRARVDAVAGGGLLAGTGTVDAAEVFVFPVAPPQSTPIPRIELPDRLGTHLTRHVGPGVEYADVRAYLPGDQLRTINWPVSARRGRLHVTERLTHRAADVVVLIDTSMQPPGPASAALERVVLGAAQVVQSALRNGDRAGIVALGSARPRWISADIGQRQFYRVLDAALCVGNEYEITTGTLAPRVAVPPGAIVFAFSTLLDTAFALALTELRSRRHAVVAVDVLEGPPFDDDQAPTVARMWALQRHAMYRDMGIIGVDVVPWPSTATLDQALRLMPVRRRAAGR
ncbi:DUF58 domain-containing protein [Mycolicibacterium sp. CBMA 226]|uniref:DUF58 domain-containing protein n=1 Tax=Mycolicibacterium sp. CBMA 226 TaxID=2606611 RepID=UPI00130C3983|nr:DUF58 domain-containing protein [Mycolicibacterium sp. CBMA 226]MUL75100.1 DUF58 domain-containing protein [Mycolicibacterium sp. CBMA 226]